MYYTFQQMVDLFNQRIDQSGSPDFTNVEIDRLMNWAYDSWYRENRPNYSKDQTVKIKMQHLLFPFSFNNVQQITLNTVNQPPAMINNYRDLAKMKGKWNTKDCNGVITPVERNIVPIPLNAVDTGSQDPFNKPTDQYPKYTQDNNGTYRIINILSTTAPLSLTGTYFKELQVFNSVANPNALFEAQDFVSREVVEIAKVLAKTDIDDYESAQITEQEKLAKV